jgi:hypothetical protein
VSDGERPTGAAVDDGAEGDGQRGPWLLALGALAIGVFAFLVTGTRALFRRIRRD